MIRALGPSEPIPEGAPARYKNQDGYVRLRWLIGTEYYVEEYEHRVVAGRPVGMHVHHINQRRDDNRPENLRVMGPREHGDLHEALLLAYDPARGSRFGGYRSRSAQEKAERSQGRREALARRTADMAAMYAAGYSTTEVGAQFGIHAANVSIHLRAAGVQMRPFSSSSRRRAS